MSLQLQMKAGGLDSSMKIAEQHTAPGESVTAYYNPNTCEIVVMEEWIVPDGECIATDFKVIDCFNTIGKMFDNSLFASLITKYAY